MDAGGARRVSTCAGERVTLNEVVRRTRRALSALGAGAGCEREPAEAVGWLQTRGLDGVGLVGLCSLE